ncbi:MAG: hypothetical protein R3C24_08355 [Cyanobacteriota/Melainabacteria group bacterium]|nr:hypothetical protein [Cyanobacteria bacterium HKST-UBA01]MCB9471517.1 hypothetical protein [Candidatus Obscuribacterales bacterium]
MTTLNDKLAKIMEIADGEECSRAFQLFCRQHEAELPVPGENPLFDKAMWNASSFTTLSANDQSILEKVTGKLLGETRNAAEKTVVALKDLVTASREAAIQTWQDTLASMQWNQLVPAGATRGVGSQLVSLGTFEKQMEDIKIQINLGYLVDKDQLRILLQAKDSEENAREDVEIRVNESARGTVFSRKTNQDGSMVAPSIPVGPGEYQIQVLWTDQVIETPFFRI